MADPRIALQALTAAFERHLEACAQRRGEDDPSVVAAYDDIDGIDDADPAAQGEDLDDLDEVDHQAHPT